jgi:hypothetical protein
VGARETSPPGARRIRRMRSNPAQCVSARRAACVGTRSGTGCWCP